MLINIEKAEEYLQKSLKLIEKEVGKTHNLYAAVLNNMATFYFAENEYEKALELFEESAEICEKTFGKESNNYKNILANIEFARRIYSTDIPDIKCNSPEVIARFLKSSLENLTQEFFIVLDIDTKGKILEKREVFKGSLSMSVVHPREVFKLAIKNSASSIVCVHNHPSGDPTPSSQDIDITKRLEEVGDLVGIRLLDHIIIGYNKYVSLKEKGLMR